MTKRKSGAALEEATVKAIALISSSIKESLAITEIVSDKVRSAGTDISSLSHRQDSHEKVCAERMGNLNEKMIGLAAAITKMAESADDRFNTISNRMWGVIAGALGGAFLAACSLLVILLKHGE